MENPFRRRAAFELERPLSEIIARCQHGHPSFLHARVPEQSPRSCPDTAVPSAWLGRFWRASPGAAARQPATPGRSRPGVCPPADRLKRARPPKRAICFRLRVIRGCLAKKTDVTSGFVSILRPFEMVRPFDKLRDRRLTNRAQGLGSWHRRIRTSQAQRTWGREGPRTFRRVSDRGDSGYKSGEFPGSSCL